MERTFLALSEFQNMQQSPRKLGDGHKINYTTRFYILAQENE